MKVSGVRAPLPYSPLRARDLPGPQVLPVLQVLLQQVTVPVPRGQAQQARVPRGPQELQVQAQLLRAQVPEQAPEQARMLRVPVPMPERSARARAQVPPLVTAFSGSPDRPKSYCSSNSRIRNRR